ncbi:MAG: hypothetical protein WD766_11385 [Gemmatimonadota bacterium]
MRALLHSIRWDATLQARNGFYWASAVIVVTVGGLVLAIPVQARADSVSWVPAIVILNLQVTTFFFVAGLILLERDEGSLMALAVSPLTPGRYLGTRTITLTGLALLETFAIIAIAFQTGSRPVLLLGGAVAVAVVSTGFGAAVASRFDSANAMLLPATLADTLLLLPVLPHFGLAPSEPFLAHPLEPAMALMRLAYVDADALDLVYGVGGSILWSMAAFFVGRHAIARMMKDLSARGGR